MSTHAAGRYGFGIAIQAPFDRALDLVKDAFKAEGFGTVSELDVRRTLDEKAGIRIEPYTILGVCNPRLASRAIDAEHEVGLLLPCNVLVHECGGAVRISAQDPALMVEMVRNEALRPIADEARAGIERALARLSAAPPGA